MKKVIRLTESDIHRMVMEAMNELSPELLAHAARLSSEKGRPEQASNLSTGSLNAFDREYGWEDKPTVTNGSTTTHNCDGSITFNHPYMKPRDYECGTAETNAFAERNLKPAQRNKYYQGAAAKHRMENGLRPDGTPYGLEEAISNALRKYIK